MLAGSVEGLIATLGIIHCCCCVPHRLGVNVLGGVSALAAILSLSLSMVGLISLKVSQTRGKTGNPDQSKPHLSKDACYGPVSLPRGTPCYENVGTSTQFHREIRALSAHLQDFKLDFLTLLASLAVFHVLVLVCSLGLVLGAWKQKKVFLIPWLILIKVSVRFEPSTSLS